MLSDLTLVSLATLYTLIPISIAPPSDSPLSIAATSVSYSGRLKISADHRRMNTEYIVFGVSFDKMFKTPQKDLLTVLDRW